MWVISHFIFAICDESRTKTEDNAQLAVEKSKREKNRKNSITEKIPYYYFYFFLGGVLCHPTFSFLWQAMPCKVENISKYKQNADLRHLRMLNLGSAAHAILESSQHCFLGAQAGNICC